MSWCDYRSSIGKQFFIEKEKMDKVLDSRDLSVRIQT